MTRHRTVTALALLSLLAFSALPGTTPASAQGRGTSRLIVTRHDGAGRPSFELVDVPRGWSVRDAARTLGNRPDIDAVEEDRLMAPDWIPNDPSYKTQWHLPKIGAPAAWDISTGSATVVVAVLDSGVDATHKELAGQLVAGRNLYSNNTDTTDVTGHGTSVAGAIGALGNNTNGVASVAWGCKIMPVRISDGTGYALWSTVASALVWAADHGARVANISYQCSDSSTIQTAAQYFQSKGGVVVASAGNSGAALTSPDTPYILTVGATDSNDVQASFSNRGPIVDMVAPGVSVYTIMRGGGYGWMTGTSFSAPLTAGGAALVLSVNPALTPTQVQQILKNNADDKGTVGRDDRYGTGRLNVQRALAAAYLTRVP